MHPTDPRVALSAGYDGRVIVWDIWAGRALRIFQVAELELVDARFSPDGTAIIASNEVRTSKSCRLLTSSGGVRTVVIG